VNHTLHLVTPLWIWKEVILYQSHPSDFGDYFDSTAQTLKLDIPKIKKKKKLTASYIVGARFSQISGFALSMYTVEDQGLFKYNDHYLNHRVDNGKHVISNTNVH